MKSFLKNALAHSFIWRPVCSALRPTGVSVLMYHRIKSGGDRFPGTSVRLFEMQMRWLKENCEVIAPEDIGEVPRRPTRGRPAVLLTFDDGFRDYHDNASPILRDLGFTGLVFLATGSMDDQSMIWTDAVTWMCSATARPFVDLPWDPAQRVALNGDAGRAELERDAKRFLKAIPDAQRRNWLGQLARSLGVDPDDGAVERQMLNWDEVRATLDCTRYGGHTHTHPIMSQIDEAAMEAEIMTCRRRIVEETRLQPSFFAYPNGRAEDFTEVTKGLLRKHGFEFAFSTIEGLHREGDDLFEIRRQNTAGDTLGDFALRVFGR